MKSPSPLPLICQFTIQQILLYAIVRASPRIYRVHQTEELYGRTPCCSDRLNSLTCSRMKLNNPRKFANRCQFDADFGLVQCCSSCFDPKKDNSSENYHKLVQNHLLNPYQSNCGDRRGGDWCARLVHKNGIFDKPIHHGISCTSFPFAFRECRMSCGYCSVGTQITKIKYDHSLATDRMRCDIKVYFSRSDEEMKKRYPFWTNEFDPLANVKLQRRFPDDDYFVVLDHQYKNQNSKNFLPKPAITVTTTVQPPYIIPELVLTQPSINFEAEENGENQDDFDDQEEDYASESDQENANAGNHEIDEDPDNVENLESQHEDIQPFKEDEFYEIFPLSHNSTDSNFVQSDGMDLQNENSHLKYGMDYWY